MSEKKISIIILNWNSYDDTASLLDLLVSRFQMGHEIIVVDNGSKDGSQEKLGKHSHECRIVLNGRNLGYAGGNNIGVQIALAGGAEYIWILNPDIRPEPETLPRLIKCMDENDSIGAIGPRICYRNYPNIIYSDGGLIFPEKGYLVVHKNHGKRVSEVGENRSCTVDYVNGSAILVRGEAFKDAGTFRENFFLYFDEAEWCLRAESRGWKCAVDSRARAYHTSSIKGPRYHYFMARNRVLLARLSRQYLMKTLCLEFTIIRGLIQRPYCSCIPNLSARAAGIFAGIVMNIK